MILNRVPKFNKVLSTVVIISCISLGQQRNRYVLEKVYHDKKNTMKTDFAHFLSAKNMSSKEVTSSRVLFAIVTIFSQEDLYLWLQLDYKWDSLLKQVRYRD